MTVIPAIADVFRDFETAGVPASGVHCPSKPEVRAVLTDMESRIASAVASTSLIYGTRSALFANLAPVAGSRAEVRNDATLGYNGIYAKSGGSGSGGWTRIADLPDDVVRLSVTGGSANVIIAAPTPQLPVTKGNKLYLLRPTATNTGAVTIDDGSGPVAIKTVFGNELAAGALLIDTENVLVWTLDHYQLLIAASVDASSILADAQAAAVTATNAAATVDLPAVAADTFIVGNPGGTARVNKTPAEARALLEVPSFSELPHFVASEYGVDGGGGDQTVALQNIITNLIPAEGGTILLPPGDIYITNIDLNSRRNILIKSQAGIGSGATQRSRLYTSTGAGAGRMFDLRDTVNVSFEDIYAVATSTSHDGTMFDYGAISSGSANMGMRNCYLHSNGPTAKVLSLYGATTGSWERIHFAGAGKLIALQEVDGVGWCNVHQFRSCNFNAANQYPVVGGGDLLSFIGCNWQAGSSDGVARAINTSTQYNSRGITLIGCGFYDTLTAGGQWVVIPWASGIAVSGCFMGGAASGSDYGIALGGTSDADPEIGGVRGVAISGNVFDNLTAAINFVGNDAAKSNVRGGWAGGNRVVNGVMYSNIASVKDWVNLPNHVYDNANDIGSHFGLYGYPTSSTGLTSGHIWSNSGVLTIVN